jgi:hypothetical protein
MEKSGNGKFFNKDGALVNSYYDAKEMMSSTIWLSAGNVRTWTLRDTSKGEVCFTDV